MSAKIGVPGIRIGHFTDLANGTGCTVVLCPPEGAVAGVDVRGPAPATRETDLMRPGHLVERVHAILLTGGSAFGLDAAGGIMRYLEEQGIGFDTGVAKVPIVPAAAIFDLAFGNARVRPTAEDGYRACVAASDGPIAEGNVGAGTGATVGHLLGSEWSTKGGLGVASRQVGDGIAVSVIVVVNAFGDVVDPHTGKILAGTRNSTGGWLGSEILHHSSATSPWPPRTNTTIGVVATDAALTKEEANLVAMMAHDGLARSIRPAHTLHDGDAVFALAAGVKSGDTSSIGDAAAELVAEAVVRAVNSAETLHGVPSRRDWAKQHG